MRLLLDTHALLWFLSDDPQLGPAARALIASLWEIAIKVGLGS